LSSFLDGLFSHFIRKVFFAVAGGLWLFISTLNFKSRRALQEETNASGFAEVERSPGKWNYLADVKYGILAFLEGIWVGGKLVFKNRRFICKFLFFVSFSSF